MIILLILLALVFVFLTGVLSIKGTEGEGGRMNKKAVRWLYQELPRLVAQGVLAEESAVKLRQYYGDVKAVDRKWMVIIICGVLGALLIGLGIILLLGHNWEQLSRSLRAVISMGLLSSAQALAFWVMKKRGGSDALKEASATFLSLMVGASIALVAQTYHIPGSTEEFLLTWMLLILPLVYLMEASVPAMIYAAGIAAWCGISSGGEMQHQGLFYWPLTALVIPHFLWGLRQKMYLLRAKLLALVLAFSVCCGVGFTLGRTWPGDWAINFSSLFALLYLIGARAERRDTLSKSGLAPLHSLGWLGSIILAFVLTNRFSWGALTSWRGLMEQVSWYSAPEFMILIMLFGGGLLLCLNSLGQKDWVATAVGVLPLVTALGYVVAGEENNFAALLFNGYIFMLSGITIAEGIRKNSLRTLNMGMVILAVLIVLRFFDQEIGFLVKGVVFIVMGAGFLAVNGIMIRKIGGRS